MSSSMEPIGGTPPEPAMDLKQFFGALRRSWLFVVLIVALITGIVVAASYAQPKQYRATGKIVLRSATDSIAPTDVQTVIRRLATIQALITTPNVLATAARALPGETERSLQGSVHASVEQNANIVDVTSTARSPQRASDIVNSVTKTFLTQDRAAQLAQVDAARASLGRELVQETQRLAGEPAAVIDAQLQSLRQRISDLDITAASAGQDLQVAQAARPPTGPDSPSPLRNAILAVLASLFFAILAVYARARLEPRVSDARELSRLTDIPVLATVPALRTLRRGTAATVDTTIFQSLQTLIRLQLPNQPQQRILVTCASRHASQARVTAGLARALTINSHPTLVVCANFGDQELEQELGATGDVGLAELLQSVRGDRRPAVTTLIDSTRQPPNGKTPPEAPYVLPSGKAPDRRDVLAGDQLEDVFDEIKQTPFEYVLVDGPPLFAIAETRVLARYVDAVLVVANPEHQSPEDAAYMRALLDALDVPPLGLVVVGAPLDLRSLDYLSYAEN